jgi:hypothetical protein
MFYLLSPFRVSGVACLRKSTECLSTHSLSQRPESSSDGDVVTLISIAQQVMTVLSVLRTADVDQWFALVMKAVYGLVMRK